jgi:hypothetical protein
MILILLALPVTSHAYTWFTYGGSEYALTNDWNFWAGAEAEAQAVGGHLAAITSEGENAFLTNTFTGTLTREGTEWFANAQSDEDKASYLGWNSIAWIGLYRTNMYPPNLWQWNTGETYAYASWSTSSLDESGVHAYLHVASHYEPGTWNANGYHDYYSSGAQAKGIIERPAFTPVPEPTTMLLLSLGLVGLAGVRRKFKS